MVIAPAIFSLKMALHTDFPFSSDASWNEYWNQVYYWPLRLVIVTAILILLWKKFDNDQPFYGLTIKNLLAGKVQMEALCLNVAMHDAINCSRIYPTRFSCYVSENKIRIAYR